MRSSHDTLVDYRALRVGQRIDGSVGRDGSGRVCNEGKVANVAVPGQGVVHRARERTGPGRPPRVRRHAKNSRGRFGGRGEPGASRGASHEIDEGDGETTTFLG